MCVCSVMLFIPTLLFVVVGLVLTALVSVYSFHWEMRKRKQERVFMDIPENELHMEIIRGTNLPVRCGHTHVYVFMWRRCVFVFSFVCVCVPVAQISFLR